MRLLLGDTYYIKCTLLNTSGSIMFYLSGKSEITSQIRNYCSILVFAFTDFGVKIFFLRTRNGGVNF